MAPPLILFSSYSSASCSSDHNPSLTLSVRSLPPPPFLFLHQMKPSSTILERERDCCRERLPLILERHLLTLFSWMATISTFNSIVCFQIKRIWWERERENRDHPHLHGLAAMEESNDYRRLVEDGWNPVIGAIHFCGVICVHETPNTEMETFAKSLLILKIC